MFDFGILSGCAKKAEASQRAGRLKGNIKGWPGYKPPVVYTTQKFNTTATELEDKSRRLAVAAFEKQEKGEDAVITRNSYKTLGQDHEYIRHRELFPDMKAVHKFFARPDIYRDAMGLENPPKPRRVTQKVRDQCEGYALSTKLLPNGKTSKDLNASDRLTLEKANQIGEGTHISPKDGKGSRYLVLPVYESLETPADKEQYQVRYLKLK